MAWPVATIYVGLALYIASPRGAELWATVAGVLAFGLVPLLLADVRPDRESLLSPLNWFLVMFFVQLVVAPLLACWYGPARWVFPHLPTFRSMNLAMLVDAGAFLAWPSA